MCFNTMEINLVCLYCDPNHCVDVEYLITCNKIQVMSSIVDSKIISYIAGLYPPCPGCTIKIPPQYLNNISTVTILLQISIF